MLIYNHTTKKWEKDPVSVVKGIVYCNDDYIEFGYFNPDYKLPIVYYNGSQFPLFVFTIRWCIESGIDECGWERNQRKGFA